MKTKDILDLKIDSEDFPEDLTIRGYLILLLQTLFMEGEGFSGKRPFGNSCWESDLYWPLAKADVIEGGTENYNHEAARAIIKLCIDSI